MEDKNPIYTRVSVRCYDASRRANANQIKEVLAAAMHAPSAMNCRPWEFVVVTNPDVLKAIMEIHPYCASLGDAGTAIIVCGNLDTQYKTEFGGYYVYDCSAAAQNILIRAKELGLDTCWCGIAPNRPRMEEFCKLLGMPKNIEPMALIILGYAKGEIPRPKGGFEEKKVHMQKW